MSDTDDELHFLRWFWCNADFGPADEDVRDCLRAQYEAKTGRPVPEGYKPEEY